MAIYHHLSAYGRERKLKEEIAWLQRRVDELAGESSRNRTRAVTAERKLDVMASEVVAMTEELRAFTRVVTRLSVLTESRNHAHHLAERLDREFGAHRRVRELAQTLLRCEGDPGLFAQELTTATPVLREAADRYWLAPAALAHAAWLLDDREEAERRMREAILRDDARASLFFSLMARRFGRTSADAWLGRYFLCQRPDAMDPEAADMFIAACEGAWGRGGRQAAFDAAERWLAETEAEDGREEPRWRDILLAMAAPPEEEEGEAAYAALREYSPSWKALAAGLEWAAVQKGVAAFIRTGLEGEGGAVPASAVPDPERGLRRLVETGPEEERLLARELLLSRLVMEESGDLEAAEARLAEEWPPERPSGVFGEMMADILAGGRKTSAGTLRLALVLSRARLEAAYRRLRDERHPGIPEKIAVRLHDWSGETVRGENESDLRAAFSKYDRSRNHSEVRPIWAEESLIVGGVVVGLVSVVTATTILVPLVAIGGYGYFVYLRHMQREKEVEEETRQREEDCKHHLDVLSRCLADSAAIRRQFTASDRECDDALVALSALSPSHCVGDPLPAQEGGATTVRPGLPDWDLMPPVIGVKAVAGPDES